MQAWTVRDATVGECGQLSALCMRSKAHWGYGADFMERCREALALTPEDLRDWTVRVAEDPHGRVQAVAAVSLDAGATPHQAELERLFVEPSAIGRGAGRALLQDLIAGLRAREVEALWILADPGAEPFYRAMGATRLGEAPSDAIAGRMLPRLRMVVSGGLATLRTPRLTLRPWRDADLPAFAALSADPKGARFLGDVLDRNHSDALAQRIRQHWARRGFGLWAVERTDAEAEPFIGCVGLMVPRFDAAFMPCVEIGWRLAHRHWGAGLATEAAHEALRWGFQHLRLREIVAFTVESNRASRRVMEKIGMQRDIEADFLHPCLPQGHPLQLHVLYRMARTPLYGSRRPQRSA